MGGTDSACIYAFSDTIPPLDGNEPTYAFTDISGTGTQIVLGDDQVSGAIPLGFPFDYYGATYSDVRVSSNGFLTFLSGQSSGCCGGGPLPGSGSPNATIAGWWEDLLPGVGAGTVSYETTGTVGSQVFIVQFTNVNHYPGGTPVTFQFKLFEASDEIEVHYQSVTTDFNNPHSAGIESQNGTIGIQWQLGSSLTFTNTAVRYYTASSTDSDSDTVPDACDLCPGVDDNDPSVCAHLYSVSRDDSILRRINPGTGDSVSSVAMSGGDIAIEGANGLAVDPRDGTLWTLLRASKPVTNCDLDPSRTIFAGGPDSRACRQFDGDQTSCEQAFHTGEGGVASCWYDSGSTDCSGCGPNNEGNGDCTNTCRTIECADDPTRTIYAGGPGSSACHQFDGDEASCEQAYHLGDGGVASCWYDSGSAECSGCGPNNEVACACVNTCGSLIGRTLASVDPSTGALAVAGNTGLHLAGIAVDCEGEIDGVTGNGAALTTPSQASTASTPRTGLQPSSPVF